MSPALLAADERLRQGQTCEAQGGPADLAHALACYHEALALLTAEGPGAAGEARRLRGIIWMNIGNAHRKQATPDSPAEAVADYDRAIAMLDTGAAGGDAAWRNSLGAAWLNRGLVRHEQGTPVTLADAIHSFEMALCTLETLPLDESRWPRLNRAAAWMNLGNAHLGSDAADRLPAARVAATQALALTVPRERQDPVAAELSLKARRVWCDAAGQLLPLAATEDETETLAREAADVVDAGLALWRHWEQGGPTSLRPAAERLFRFGARLCRQHQPQFLAEFLRENIQFAAPVREELDSALASLGRHAPFRLSDPRQERLLLAWRDLRALQAELAGQATRHPNAPDDPASR
jgi:hypothetical protein